MWAKEEIWLQALQLGLPSMVTSWSSSSPSWTCVNKYVLYALAVTVGWVPWKQTASDISKEIVRSQLHIGHSYVTHSFLLKREEPPMCIACDERQTVEHVSLFCPELIWDETFFNSITEDFFCSRKCVGYIFEYLKKILKIGGLYTL